MNICWLEVLYDFTSNFTQPESESRALSAHRLTFEELEPAAARDVGGRVVVDLFVAAAAVLARSRRRRSY